jgi:hypothetical protein
MHVNFKNRRLGNVLDPVNDRDAVNLRYLRENFSSSGGANGGDAFDSSSYYTKDEVDGMIELLMTLNTQISDFLASNVFVTQDELTTQLATYVTTSSMPTHLTGYVTQSFLDNYMAAYYNSNQTHTLLNDLSSGMLTHMEETYPKKAKRLKVTCSYTVDFQVIGAYKVVDVFSLVSEFNSTELYNFTNNRAIAPGEGVLHVKAHLVFKIKSGSYLNNLYLAKNSSITRYNTQHVSLHRFLNPGNKTGERTITFSAQFPVYSGDYVQLMAQDGDYNLTFMSASHLYIEFVPV